MLQEAPPDLIFAASKGRLYGANLRAVARVGGQCRALWNLFLAASVERYGREGKFLFYAEMSRQLPRLLREDPRLVGLPHRAAQMMAARLDRALQKCGRNRDQRSGFPKYKRRDVARDSFSFVAKEVAVEPGRVRLPRIGWLRVRGLSIPAGASLKVVTVTQDRNNWHVTIQFSKPRPVSVPPTKPAVGVDVGVSRIATFSDGSILDPARLAQKAAARIRRLNRHRDRCAKGSVNRRRVVARLAKAHRAVGNARADFIHKATRRLVETYEGFAVEDLSLRGLMRTRIAKAMADAGLGEFLRVLRYKAEWAGRSWHVHGRFQRSTGVCPDCSHTGPRLSLSVREWTCESCGTVHDRDVAAARVILSSATAAEVAGVGQALPEPAGVTQRKRGPVEGAGDRASARSRRHESPPNASNVERGGNGWRISG